VTKKPKTVPGHKHSWICTEESCPGNGFVTKTELVLRTLAKKVSRV